MSWQKSQLLAVPSVAQLVKGCPLHHSVPDSIPGCELDQHRRQLMDVTDVSPSLVFLSLHAHLWVSPWKITMIMTSMRSQHSNIYLYFHIYSSPFLYLICTLKSTQPNYFSIERMKRQYVCNLFHFLILALQWINL